MSKFAQVTPSLSPSSQGISDKSRTLMARRMIPEVIERDGWKRKTVGPKRLIRLVEIIETPIRR